MSLRITARLTQVFPGMTSGIISIADSLDAGTDNVGRSYAQAKSFDTLVDEIRQGRGSRYDERVAALFDDESFCAQLRDSLHKERESVYCDTYLGKRSAPPTADLTVF